jgi:diguanylate cyclase
MKEAADTPRETKEKLLSSAGIFQSLSDDEIGPLAENSGLYELEAGENLYSVGWQGAELYVIERGRISISRISEEGIEEPVARFVDGESFGELDLLDESPREETARADMATRILIFPRRGESFPEILTSRPALSARLLQKLMAAVASRLRQANNLIKENSPWIRELQEQVYTDPLTGLHNRTFLEENLPRYLTAPSCGLIFLKPDNFKQINDSYGHEAGDAAIREIGEYLSSRLVTGEELIRFMGNEYAVLAPGNGTSAARLRAEELRRGMSEINYEKSLGKNDIVVSVSAGVAVYPDHGQNPAELIAAAHALALRGRTLGGSRLLLPREKI